MIHTFKILFYKLRCYKIKYNYYVIIVISFFTSNIEVGNLRYVHRGQQAETTGTEPLDKSSGPNRLRSDWSVVDL